MWAKQGQILAYMEHVSKKYGLDKHIECSTMVKHSEWNEDTSKWEVHLIKEDSQRTVISDYLVMACGALHVPQFPNLKGLNPIDGSSSFCGDSFHAAQWDHRVSYAGKRVGGKHSMRGMMIRQYIEKDEHKHIDT
jgi:cation diffusion facilitator CzcD-associated flavoprotein CzcO